MFMNCWTYPMTHLEPYFSGTSFATSLLPFEEVQLSPESSGSKLPLQGAARTLKRGSLGYLLFTGK